MNFILILFPMGIALLAASFLLWEHIGRKDIQENNDYSEIWEERCTVCFKYINKDIDDDIYVKECCEKLKE